MRSFSVPAERQHTRVSEVGYSSSGAARSKLHCCRASGMATAGREAEEGRRISCRKSETCSRPSVRWRTVSRDDEQVHAAARSEVVVDSRHDGLVHELLGLFDRHGALVLGLEHGHGGEGALRERRASERDQATAGSSLGRLTAALRGALKIAGRGRGARGVPALSLAGRSVRSKWGLSAFG